MITLSLFDGMSCGQIALKELGVKVDKYYASEIDKFAIKQTQHNFPETIQLGSVTEWRTWDIDWSSIDLILAGSPCQGFSFAGKQLAFDDPRSKLFFVFVEILNHCRKFNPGVKFLLENVDMKKEHLRIISEYVGVFPVKINSALLSAQNRERWYWTNIRIKNVGLFDEVYTDISQPEDKGILLPDVLQPESEVDKKYYLSKTALARLSRKIGFTPQIKPEKTGTLNTKNNSGQLSVDNGTTLIIADKDVGHNPKVFNQGKTPPLRSTNGCAHDIKVGFGVLNNNGELVLADVKANCIDANYTKGMDNHSQRTHVLSLNENRSQSQRIQLNANKSVCLNGEGGGGGAKTGLYQFDDKVRRLTPLECSRLQTIPSWYRWIVSDSQIYRMLGNGWTIKVIEHILSFYKVPECVQHEPAYL